MSKGASVGYETHKCDIDERGISSKLHEMNCKPQRNLASK